ncbi:hypothetical protein [Spirosoma montaniterrae]|uniref:Ppx/GppA phosphatase domain-containing protein n=1 Tax=Spirosoma montaniterrae TaxID=1178516 RepID=A0A1P9WSH1_9BACT|nr:hypothetical protein [Spirosoma montaniterrae]AQG78307.1 hypothetical protein AWR27_02495 [Spirosoma montaniterrae]
MPHILRIDNDPNVSQQNHQGWTGTQSGLTGSRIEHIKDTLSGGSIAAKAGTSIPSPFARLYLFDTAFRLVKNDANPRELTLYHVLVSHALDMLELLFQAGNSPDLTYRVWNRTERLSALNQKNGTPTASGALVQRHSHQILAKALELDLRGDLANLYQFTLIYYKGALLGGTSPLTLVFTSPNWEQERQNKYIESPRSTNGRVLFQNEYVSLAERDEAFVTYLRRLYDGAGNQLLGGFKEYLYKVFFDSPVPLPITPNTTLDSFEPIQIGGESNSVLQVLPGLALYKVREADLLQDIEQGSDFVMEPTATHYQRETRHGAPTGVRKPLAVASRMEVSGRYVKNTPWNPQTVVMRSSLNNLAEGGLLADRYLPGVDNVKYPFVTTDDFLEDFLIRMPFKINNARFLTGVPGDTDVLLPIRKEYFNFFTTDDLKRQLSIREESRGMDRVLIVALRIPIRNNRSVDFRKEYNLGKPETVIDFRAGLAFFPFYRITVPEPDWQRLNQYTVMLADWSDYETGFQPATSLRFFQIPNVVNNQPVGVNTPEVRSPKSEQPASYYYKVAQPFDLAEVRLERNGIPYRGLVLPQFTLIDQKGYKPFTFAIDFGTSNTHIAYTDAVAGGVDPKALTISDDRVNLDKDELQMVMLNKPYDGTDKTTYERYRLPVSFGKITPMEPLIRREFIPPIIGKEFGSPFAFPLRTTVYEKSGFTDSRDNLFSKVNLGFNIDLESGNTGVNHYVTNLKWLFENQPADTLNRPRVRAFFETLLLLIRNKIVLNQGDISKAGVVWLAPSSMRAMTEESLVQELKQAFENVFGHTRNFRDIPVPESLAPYYYLVKQGVKSFADTVNVDIGGGTTDIMLFMRQQDRYLNTSFRFAGYDIWGGGLNEQGYPSHRKDNGFVENYKKYRKTLQQEQGLEFATLDTFLNTPELTAEDIVSLLFKYNDQFKFVQSIQDGKPAMRLVLYLHYASIVYHLVQVIESHGLGLPRYLTFTGRGSQYLNMLGSLPRLITFTKMLFRSYTTLPVPPDFEVLLTNNPKETTANGAVLFENSGSEKSQYERRETSSYWGQQLDKSTPFEYRRTTIGEARAQKDFHDSVLLNVKSFLEKTLLDRDVAYFLREYNIQTPEKYYEFLTGSDVTRGGRIYDSYMLARMGMERSPNEAISETFFFLPLKHALYELSKFIAEG